MRGEQKTNVSGGPEAFQSETVEEKQIGHSSVSEMPDSKGLELPVNVLTLFVDFAATPAGGSRRLLGGRQGQRHHAGRRGPGAGDRHAGEVLQLLGTVIDGPQHPIGRPARPASKDGDLRGRGRRVGVAG